MTTFEGPPAETEPGIGALTFGGFLEDRAGRFGERPALLYVPAGGTRVLWSYRRLREEARAVAKGLIGAGVNRGTRVGVLMGARPEWVAAVWGAAMAGGVALPFNTFAEPPELQHLLRHSDASVLLTETALLRHRFVDELLELCPEARTSKPGRLRASAYPFLRSIAVLDGEGVGAVQSWEEFLNAGLDVPDPVLDAAMRETVPSEDGIIIYSSGSTSAPKGVLHRHRAAMLQSWRHAHREHYVPDDRVYCALPLFWSAGFAAVMGATFASGACLVVSSYFDADHALRVIEQERVTVAQALDNQAAEMLAIQQRSPRDLSSIRRNAFRFTGPMPPPGAARPANRASYGSSETFTSATGLPEEAPEEERKTHGRLIAGSSIRILDRDTADPLGVGKEGEIILKGLTLMRGYVKVAPEDTFDDEGYFHTGDLGWFDEHGLLHYSGRLTNIIKTSGANVSPLEVEAALLSNAGIKRAVVVGVPDPVAGELVVACVVPQPDTHVTEEQVRQYLRSSLSAYKIPHRVLVFPSEEALPRTGSEKFNVPATRALAAQRLGLEP